MKALVLCFLLFAAAGCTHPDQRQAAPLTLPEASIDAPVKQENKQEAQAQSQLAGIQFGKLEAEANALKLENGDLKNDVAFLKAEKSTLLSEISLVKADNLKLTGVQMDNAKLQSEISGIRAENVKLITEVTGIKEASAKAQVAYEARIEELKQENQAGRDIYQQTVQFNEKHVQAMKNEQEAHFQVVYVFCGVIVMLVKLGAFVVCKIALGSRNRAYKRAGEGPLIERPASWWSWLPWVGS